MLVRTRYAHKNISLRDVARLVGGNKNNRSTNTNTYVHSITLYNTRSYLFVRVFIICASMQYENNNNTRRLLSSGRGRGKCLIFKAKRKKNSRHAATTKNIESFDIPSKPPRETWCELLTVGWDNTTRTVVTCRARDVRRKRRIRAYRFFLWTRHDDDELI